MSRKLLMIGPIYNINTSYTESGGKDSDRRSQPTHDFIPCSNTGSTSGLPSCSQPITIYKEMCRLKEQDAYLPPH